MAFNKETILGISLTGFGIFLYCFIIPCQVEFQYEGGAMSSAFFPKAGTVLLIILSVIFTAASIKGNRKPKPKPPDPIERRVKLNVFFSALCMGFYIFAIALVGFVAATPPLLILLMVILGARIKDWVTILITASVTTVAIYYIFMKILGLPMP
ncbi:MAG: tripartite tricarboxylate transporter TctB family protein [Desulfobacterales bacterium]|nr:tripartite tricarboxylate transporter TctB family protein [Desulfobacterales bacterium]